MDTARFRQLADLLADIGEPCWVGGPTAAALHHYEGFPLAPPFTVLVPVTRRVSRPPHTIRRAFVEAADVTRLAGVPVLNAAATLLAVAADTPDDRLGRCVATYLSVHSADKELHHRIVASRRRDPATAARLLRAVSGAEGLDTFLEREALRMIASAGLPQPEVRRIRGRGGRLSRLELCFGSAVVTVVYSLQRCATPSYVDLLERREVLIDRFRAAVADAA
jgi:hypothetical protein